uniref:Uncharacterized protein LOC113790169 isoform X1 n=1 Tax=Dermatophagoides pteronyssinus TaxID=6956 RepID=A0A6P6XRW6_DERPT|nr:uncharacterized protein LOC113790169 isoform X1 [Dermatophagoides pteronyssinus]
MVFIFYIQTNSRGTAEFRLRWRILYDIDVIIEIDIGGPSPTSNIWKIQIPRRFLLNVPRNWNDILYTLENLMYCSISGEQFSELESGIIIEEEIRTDMREYYQNHGFEPRKPWAMVIRAAYARKDFVWN